VLLGTQSRKSAPARTTAAIALGAHQGGPISSSR